MDMLPIAVYPSVVEEFLPKVRDSFSKPQLKQFARYLTGIKTMILGNDCTLTGQSVTKTCKPIKRTI
jgi:hypothetical protein